MGGINSNVVLLLHGDGSDGGTVIYDTAKGVALTATVATTASAVKKFGTGAIKLLNNGYVVNLSAVSNFAFASLFTIDLWLYLNSTSDWSTNNHRILNVTQDESNRWALNINSIGGGSLYLTFGYQTGGSWWVNSGANIPLHSRVWQHVALTKDTSFYRLFYGGSLIMSVAGPNLNSMLGSATIGYYGTLGAQDYLQGYIDEFRITKGVAVWTEAFTPPTEPYTMDLPVATVTFGDDGAKAEATWSGEGTAAAVTTTISASDNPATITLTAEGVSGSTKLHNVGYAAVITMTMYANSCQPIAGSIETTLDQVTFEGDAYKVLEAELSPITFAATARTDIVGGLEEFLENIEASLHGSQEILGSITRDLRPITLSAASIYRHILGSIDGTLHPIILTEQIKGIKGISCTLSVTLPNIELSATAIQNIHASLSQDLPAITAELEIESLVFEIIAMNLLNKAITNFSNYPFNSFCYFDGKYFGCARDGIYQLTGIDDFGADISAHVQFGLLDLEVTLLKRVRHAYLGFKSSGQLTLTITTDDNESYSYTTEHFNGNYGGQKVKFGKGFKDRYIQLKIANTDGCTFALDKTRVFDEPISHRRR